MGFEGVGYVSEYNPLKLIPSGWKPVLLSALANETKVVPIYYDNSIFDNVVKFFPEGSHIVWRLLSADNVDTNSLKMKLEGAGYVLINGSGAALNSKDKLLTFKKMVEAGVPAIPTVKIEAGEAIPFNHVVKPRGGMKGDNILFGVNDVEFIPDGFTEFVPLISNKKWVLQPYVLDSKNWWRVLIVNQKVITAYKRVPAANTIVANVHKGACRQFDKPDEEMVEVSLAAAQVSGLTICGVDITSKPYQVVEVNSIPVIPEGFAKEAAKELILYAGRLK